MREDYRIDHYYSIEGDGEIEEGHIFCTPEEGERISKALSAGLPPHVRIVVEPGGEYDYTTEVASAEDIAADIVANTGFTDELLDEEEDDASADAG